MQEENINSWLHQINESAKAAVSVDCVIFGYEKKELKVLLIDCNMPPYLGKKSLVGDLVHKNENLQQSAQRILNTRAGIEDLYMEQVQTFGEPGRHPLGRVISIAYFTLVPAATLKIDSHSSRHPQWIKVDEIEEMAFDHIKILKRSLKALKTRIHNAPLVFNLVPDKFTLIELQEIYETILNAKLDKRNFRRKVNKLPYIVDLDETQSDVSHRPAKLYKFNFKKYTDDLSTGTTSFRM